MEVEIYFSGMCLFEEGTDGSWNVRVIDGKNPKGRKKSKDAKEKTVLHHHEAAVWLEIGAPVGDRPGGKNLCRKTEFSDGDDIPMRVYPLGGLEELSFEVRAADDAVVPITTFALDPSFKRDVASLSEVDRTVKKAGLAAIQASPLAAVVRIDRGELSSSSTGGVDRWAGSDLGKKPKSISTSALWSLTTAEGRSLRIASTVEPELCVQPIGDCVRLWIVSYPVHESGMSGMSSQAKDDDPTAGHFKWYYELYDFNGTTPAAELAHPIPEAKMSVSGKEVSAGTLTAASPIFCPETRT